jgi:spoIIIJ-associated protein
MIKVYEYTEKSLELAREKALYELKSSETDILTKESEENAGLFKSKKYKLYIIKKDEVLEYVKELLKEIIEKMGIDVKIEAQKREDYIKFNLYSQNNPILIGKGGKTIDSLQSIVRSSVLNNTGFKANIIIDVEGYKEQQKRNLEYTAKKLAQEVQRTGVEVTLDPMNSYERRVVHNVCNEFKGIVTESKGEEPERYIVIKKKEE